MKTTAQKAQISFSTQMAHSSLRKKKTEASFKNQTIKQKTDCASSSPNPNETLTLGTLTVEASSSSLLSSLFSHSRLPDTKQAEADRRAGDAVLLASLLSREFWKKRMSISDACSACGEEEGEGVTKNELEEYGDNEFEEKMQFDDVKEMTITQSTLKYLSREGYLFNTRRELPSGEVDILFFSHPDSFPLLKLFPYVVVIDGTYKMKRYGMSLVKIVGYTSMYKPFYAALVLTKGESIPHYLFILRRLEKLYADLGVKPTAIVTDLDNSLISATGQVFGDKVKHLLCLIHIKQKIKLYARSVIKKDKDMVEAFADECCELFSSTTEEMYLERLRELRDGWNSVLVGYMENTWLRPFKENIVRAWTDYVPHFFIASKKRVKMIPNSLKQDLESTQHGLNSIIRVLNNHLDSQHRDARGSFYRASQTCLVSALTLPPHIKPLFSPLFYNVSEPCLRMLLDMYDDILKGKISTDCNHQWWRTCYGLPCIHRIKAAMLYNTPIMPREIHLFWRQVSWRPIEDVPGGSKYIAKKKPPAVNKVERVPEEDWGVKLPNEICLMFMSSIIDAKKVAADGHCGYRSLAVQLGWTENRYVRVRMDIASELVDNKEIYMKITPSIANYDALLERVNSIITPCREPYWMEMPIVGLAFATRYHVALVHLDWDGGCLCLPMKASSGSDKPSEKIMSIASIQNHFVPLWLTDSSPLPPVSKYWRKFKHPSVDGWGDFYYDRIEKWRSRRLCLGHPAFL